MSNVLSVKLWLITLHTPIIHFYFLQQKKETTLRSIVRILYTFHTIYNLLLQTLDLSDLKSLNSKQTVS